MQWLLLQIKPAQAVGARVAVMFAQPYTTYREQSDTFQCSGTILTYCALNGVFILNCERSPTDPWKELCNKTNQFELKKH